MGESIDYSSLLVPGREDMSFYPPVGQLSFDVIKEMTPQQIDERLAWHLQNAEPFKDIPRTWKDHPEQMLIIKKLTLARLEGFSFNNSQLIEFYDPEVLEESVGNILRANISTYGSDALRKRIGLVNKRLAREAFALSERDPSVQKILQEINTLFRTKNLITEDLHLVDILKWSNLPRHREFNSQVRKTGELTMYALLEIFKKSLVYDEQEGSVYKKIGAGRSVNSLTIASQISKHLTPRAKTLLRTYRGYKKTRVNARATKQTKTFV